MKKILFCALGLLAGLSLTACSGGGSDSESAAFATGGYAPATIKTATTLTPDTASVLGVMSLEAAPSEVATFKSKTGGTERYLGNYRYTKTGPNTAHLELLNMRYEPNASAADCIWTLNLYLTFTSDTTVMVNGTETLINVPEGEGGGPNDPFTFGGDNHFADLEHLVGGSRNLPTTTYTISH